MNNNEDNKRAMKSWRELRLKFRSGWCVVTINDRVVLMSVLADDPMSVYKLLGKDTKASAKAITTASKIDGYSYFGYNYSLLITDTLSTPTREALS